jgi:putative membrane protein
LEKKVWVLADKGIYEKIQQQTLDRFAANVSQGIRLGRACETLCRAIEEMGERLAEHFPLIEGDINELPNDVLTE